MQDKYLTIIEINEIIKETFNENPFLNKVYLRGEISNYKNHTRGHLYFTLKDETSRINAVMFSSSAAHLKFTPEDGMNVLVKGRISTYPATGSYQIYIESMELDGVGKLYVEFEKLKVKLSNEGLFNEEHKKEIPKYPNKVGVITASTGAAIRDIITTIKRRYPICEVILFPSLVQGGCAAPDIIKSLKKADTYNLDTIIIGRGGGSIEDLWAFNDEILARTIYKCQTPIISAVGHEIDFTISDFVADLRAATPTAAAELAVPSLEDTLYTIKNYQQRLETSIKNNVNNNFIKLRNIKNSFILKNPLSIYEVKEQKLDNLIDSLNKNMSAIIDNCTYQFKNIENSFVLKNPMSIYEVKEQKLGNLIENLSKNINKILDNYSYQFKMVTNTLKLVNPLNILEKGYSLVSINDDIINNTDFVNIDDIINVKLFKGSIKASVKEVKKND